MARSVADEVQDDFITEDVQLARVQGGLVRRIEERLDALARDLKRLTLDVDVPGTTRRDARIKRLNRLDKDSRELIKKAYQDIAAMTRGTSLEVVKAESMAVVNSLNANIP